MLTFRTMNLGLINNKFDAWFNNTLFLTLEVGGPIVGPPRGSPFSLSIIILIWCHIRINKEYDVASKKPRTTIRLTFFGKIHIVPIDVVHNDDKPVLIFLSFLMLKQAQ